MISGKGENFFYNDTNSSYLSMCYYYLNLPTIVEENTSITQIRKYYYVRTYCTQRYTYLSTYVYDYQ